MPNLAAAPRNRSSASEDPARRASARLEGAASPRRRGGATPAARTRPGQPSAAGGDASSPLPPPRLSLLSAPGVERGVGRAGAERLGRISMRSPPLTAPRQRARARPAWRSRSGRPSGSQPERVARRCRPRGAGTMRRRASLHLTRRRRVSQCARILASPPPGRAPAGPARRHRARAGIVCRHARNAARCVRGRPLAERARRRGSPFSWSPRRLIDATRAGPAPSAQSRPTGASEACARVAHGAGAIAGSTRAATGERPSRASPRTHVGNRSHLVVPRVVPGRSRINARALVPVDGVSPVRKSPAYRRCLAFRGRCSYAGRPKRDFAFLRPPPPGWLRAKHSDEARERCLSSRLRADERCPAAARARTATQSDRSAATAGCWRSGDALQWRKTRRLADPFTLVGG